jgi:hypothetical protein
VLVEITGIQPLCSDPLLSSCIAARPLQKVLCEIGGVHVDLLPDQRVDCFETATPSSCANLMAGLRMPYHVPDKNSCTVMGETQQQNVPRKSDIRLNELVMFAETQARLETRNQQLEMSTKQVESQKAQLEQDQQQIQKLEKMVKSLKAQLEKDDRQNQELTKLVESQKAQLEKDNLQVQALTKLVKLLEAQHVTKDQREQALATVVESQNIELEKKTRQVNKLASTVEMLQIDPQIDPQREPQRDPQRELQRSGNTPLCKYGEACMFLKQGTCRYRHGTQQSRPNP